MKYRYTRDELAQFIIEHPLISTETEEFLLDLLFKKKKRGICVPEVRNNIEKMKKMDSERELVEIDKLNLDEYIENFDPLEIPSRTIGIEIMVEKKINEIIDHLNSIKKDRHSDIRKVNELSKKK